MKEEGEDLKWRHAYFFFRGLRHIQMNSQNKRNQVEDPEQEKQDKISLSSGLSILTQAIRDHGVVKSYQILKVLELSQLCKFEHHEFWRGIQEQLSLNAEFETIKDVIDVLITVKENPKFGDDFWQRMSEKIVSMSHLITCKDFIDIMKLFSSQNRYDMCKQICQVSKKNIVEEIDNLTAKDILVLLEMYKDEPEFKKFIGFKLKDKIINSVNIQLRDLMTSIVETLDLEDLRGDIIKYALQTEMFYAFPLSYLMSLLIRIFHVGLADDLKDLLKTIQIQLCLKKNEITDQTMRRIIILHTTLPIMNVHFLYLLVQTHNKIKMNPKTKNFDVQIFNLNISQVNLPNIRSKSLVEEYETAFAFELASDKADDFNLNFLIEFLQQNQMFARHGFYQGFADLIMATVLSDQRAQSDIWLVSVLNKIMSFDVCDTQLKAKIDKLIETNLERYLGVALQKTVILISIVNTKNQRYKDAVMRRVRTLHHDNFQDIRQATMFLYSLSQIDQEGDQFSRFLQSVMKNPSALYFKDFDRIILALHNQKLTEDSKYEMQYDIILDRIQQLADQQNFQELLTGVESIIKTLPYFPNSLKKKQLEVFENYFSAIEESVHNIPTRLQHQYPKYHKFMRLVLQDFKPYLNSQEFNQMQKQHRIKVISLLRRIEKTIDILAKYKKGDDDHTDTSGSDGEAEPVGHYKSNKFRYYQKNN